MKVIRLFSILFLMGLAILAGLFHFLDWNQTESILASIPYRCPLKLFTGLECAFCGMTHSWLAILRGEWAAAIHFNLLGIPVFILAVTAALSGVAGYRIDRKIKPWMVILTLLILLAYTILRN